MLVLMQDMGINLIYLMSMILKLSINKTQYNWLSKQNKYSVEVTNSKGP